MLSSSAYLINDLHGASSTDPATPQRVTASKHLSFKSHMHVALAAIHVVRNPSHHVTHLVAQCSTPWNCPYRRRFGSFCDCASGILFLLKLRFLLRVLLAVSPAWFFSSRSPNPSRPHQRRHISLLGACRSALHFQFPILHHPVFLLPRQLPRSLPPRLLLPHLLLSPSLLCMLSPSLFSPSLEPLLSVSHSSPPFTSSDFCTSVPSFSSFFHSSQLISHPPSLHLLLLLATEQLSRCRFSRVGGFVGIFTVDEILDYLLHDVISSEAAHRGSLMHVAFVDATVTDALHPHSVWAILPRKRKRPANRQAGSRRPRQTMRRVQYPVCTSLILALVLFQPSLSAPGSGCPATNAPMDAAGRERCGHSPPRRVSSVTRAPTVRVGSTSSSSTRDSGDRSPKLCCQLASRRSQLPTGLEVPSRAVSAELASGAQTALDCHMTVAHGKRVDTRYQAGADSLFPLYRNRYITRIQLLHPLKYKGNTDKLVCSRDRVLRRKPAEVGELRCAENQVATGEAAKRRWRAGSLERDVPSPASSVCPAHVVVFSRLSRRFGGHVTQLPAPLLSRLVRCLFFVALMRLL